LIIPAGHTNIFGEQVGAGKVHVNRAPPGVEVSGKFVVVPEQMDFVNGAFTAGSGRMVIGRVVVGPLPAQLELVP
jgi:hypothetical protein